MYKAIKIIEAHIKNNQHFADLAYKAVRSDIASKIPDHVWLPISFGMSYAKEYNLNMSESWEFSTYLAWWQTKGIYKIDEEVITHLVETDMGKKPLPFELLYKMPEWAIFIPYGRQNIEGFLFSIDWFDLPDREVTYKEELRITTFFEEGDPLPIYVPFISGCGLQDAITKGLHDAGVNYDGSVFEPIFRIANIGLNLLLYICSKNADIKHRLKRKPRSKRNKSVKPSKSVVNFNVGYRRGSDIQNTEGAASRGTGKGNQKAAHWRRAHWHTYRVGKGRKERVLYWMPPTKIGCKDSPVVERKIT